MQGVGRGKHFANCFQDPTVVCESEVLPGAGLGKRKATRWLSWYGVGLASADRLPVVVRILAGPLGSL